MLAAVSNGDVATLFVVLAVLAFVAALYLVFTGRAIEAIVAAIIGAILLIFA